MITGIAVPCVIAFATLIWFGIGGMRDLRDFFIALKTHTRDARDDGRVVGHTNLSEVPPLVPPSAVIPSTAPPIVKPTGA
jgi:hypothetical protein